MESVSDIIQNQIVIIEAGIRLAEVVCNAYGFQETKTMIRTRELIEKLRQIQNLPEDRKSVV